jgi:vancomycin resistance protein VanJ
MLRLTRQPDQWEPARPARRVLSTTARVVIAVIAVLLAALLGLHHLVPDWWGLGSTVDTLLPWLGAPLPLLGLGVMLWRSWAAAAAVLTAALVWMLLFSPTLVHSGPGGGSQLRLASLNLSAANPDPATSLATLAAARPDVIALQELTEANRLAADRVLDVTYPHHVVAGTVGLWSRLPIRDAAPVDIGIGWTRALRATFVVADAPVQMYVAHLASARPADTAERDHTQATLAGLLATDPSPRLLLAGDLNTATTDRRFAQFAPLHDTQIQAGRGFGFTWPAVFPLTRPDHVLYRGCSARRAWNIRSRGSDHLATLADLRLNDAADG